MDDRVVEQLIAVKEALWALTDVIAKATSQKSRAELAQEKSSVIAVAEQTATDTEAEQAAARIAWLRAGKSLDALGAPAGPKVSAEAAGSIPQRPAESSGIRRPADMGPQEGAITRPAKPSSGLGLILGATEKPAAAPAEDPQAKIAALEAELAKARAAANPQ